jgi:uncharacterized membrane protein
VTVASVAVGGGRRQHLLWVLLTLSVVLNLCFIVGAVWIRIHPPAMPPGSAERLQRIAAELPLDPQQRQAFDRYAQTVRGRMEKMRREVEPLIGQGWAEIAKPDADEAAVMQLFDEAAQARRGFQRELTTATLSFLATLSPEQRANFVELARKRPTPWGPFRHGSP